MQNSRSRRHFLKSAAGTASAFAAPYIGWKTTANGQSPSQALRFACFGANGRAWGNIVTMSAVPNCSMVAVAEVDPNRCDKVAKDYPNAKIYADWRVLLEKEAKNIDCIIVATPDHMHAPIAMSGMQLGKHAYCEKPLARTLFETRRLREFAEEHGLVSQMGTQVASSSGNQTAVKRLLDGVIGKVKSVHSMNPKSWGLMEPLPDREDPVPEGLNWDHWVGVGRMCRHISGAYHPSQWRKRIGFGTGTLGDMGCHIYHPWFMGLNSPAPLSVTSHGPGPVDGDSWPINGRIHYRMKGNDLTEGDFDFTWYDGNQFPGEEVIAAVGGEIKEDPQTKKTEITNVPKSGSVVIGTEGALVIPHGGSGLPVIYRGGVASEERLKAVTGEDHHANFAAAIRGEIKEKPRSNFSYAGPMTEAVLLGTVAMRLPGVTLDWDDAAGKFRNSPEANALIRENYREGWEVKGL